MTSERRTRKPTGLPSWPILLLAGIPKSGKSYASAEATASDLIGNTYWISVGESDPDEYGLIPGARFEIVDHDGTYRDILAAINWASHQPTVDGKPNLIVVDSVTRVWELISAMAQREANARRDRKSNGRQAQVDDEAQIHSDLWNKAADRWGQMVELLREHNKRGPVIVTALLDEITVFENDKPTKEKTWKIQGHRSLPGAATSIIEMPARGKAYLSGVVSYRMQVPERRLFPKFTVDQLWRDMGLADGEVGERHHAGTNPVEGPTVQAAPEPLSDAEKARRALIRSVYDAAGARWPQVQVDWKAAHNGQDIKEATGVGALELLRDDLASAKEGAA